MSHHGEHSESTQQAPRGAQEDSPLRRPVDPDDDAVHDMGGDIGAAEMTASSAPGAEHGAQPAQSVEPTSPAAPDTALAQSSTPPESPSLAGDGESAPEPVATTRSDYVAIDDTDNVGRGADGDTAARIEKKDEEAQ